MNIPISFDTPILLIVFNRPELTKRLVEKLAEIKPNRLFVMSDGPREHSVSDTNLIAKVRLIIDAIDWPCEISKIYNAENLGCGHSPAKGIDWVFSQVDRCIILEDDCIPSTSFFQYCSELLERYKADTRIMSISGNNHLPERFNNSESYFYSIHTQTHGWATWRRAWEKYDFYMKDWQSREEQSWLVGYLGSSRYAKTWLKTFNEVHKIISSDKQCSFWDYQFLYACWRNAGLTIMPRLNLVSNVGYGDDATHLKNSNHPLAALEAKNIEFPLIHPKDVAPLKIADQLIAKHVFGDVSFPKSIARKLALRLEKLLH